MSSSNNNLINQYKAFKSILEGCNTMFDAFYFAQKIINDYPLCKNLIIGMIYNKSFEKSIDIRTIAYTLNEIALLTYKEDIDDFIDTNIKNNVSLCQINSFLRISQLKPSRVVEKYNKNNINNINNINETKYKITSNELNELNISKDDPDINTYDYISMINP
jgi:hypothetical protein